MGCMDYCNCQISEQIKIERWAKNRKRHTTADLARENMGSTELVQYSEELGHEKKIFIEIYMYSAELAHEIQLIN